MVIMVTQDLQLTFRREMKNVVSFNVHSVVTNQCENVVIFSQSHVEEIKLTERMRDILLDSKTMKLKEIQHLLIKVKAFLRGFINFFC